jgi:hypothetical protein
MNINEAGDTPISHPTGRHREQSAERVETNTWVSVRESDANDYRPRPMEACHHPEEVTDER